MGAITALTGIIDKPAGPAAMSAAMHAIESVLSGSWAYAVCFNLAAAWPEAAFHKIPAVLQFFHKSFLQEKGKILCTQDAIKNRLLSLYINIPKEYYYKNVITKK